MKRLVSVFLLAGTMALSGCSTLQSLSGILSDLDAARAIKEALTIGANFGTNTLGQNGSFSRDVLLAAILPKEAQTIFRTLDQLGMASEINRLAGTLDNAAVETVKRSSPIFLGGIKNMSIIDAIGIVKNGGTAATDYLRNKIGDSLRRAVTPVMRTALDEYKIAQQWDKLIAPVKLVLGNKAGLNIDLDNILSVMITNEMFAKIAQQEIAIRTTAQARTTPSLQRVFGKNWNATPY